MILRMWRGWARGEGNADAYAAFLRDTFLPAAAAIAGYRGAQVLRRRAGEEIEFVTLTRFASMDAIRAFAGADAEKANVAPRARELLARWDERCTHFEIVIGGDDSPAAS
ncbi:MAG: antibiotic biosynthesis monooxygenase [Xanthobacteraceae bacterium]|nr:antibiotic biosynthesis monooxygenase [Xanthobacteraceae bacterium]PWB58129.1 MAG: antibiotic biosynthesis monooxygenase [Bradyrhizobiaceae bacterium]GIK80810.1 MAG: antibiotic biosynthesis monooxygenase [Alphaproteobacteria bacterium]